MMMQKPEVQRRAQAEIDQVIGGEDRLPTFEDTGKLPYLNLIKQEVYRSELLIFAMHFDADSDSESPLFRHWEFRTGILQMTNTGACSYPKDR